MNMAGDYLPMRLDLDEDPAVIGIAVELEMSELDVVGRLWKVWSWMNRQSRDGNAPGVTFAFLDRYACAPGLSQAMERVGWLENTADGISIPNYETWNSKGAKARLQGAERAAKHRSKSRKSNAGSVTTPLPQDSTVQESTREERGDHFFSWKEKRVQATQLKDWCRATFVPITDARKQRPLASDPETRDLLLRVGVLRLCGAVSEAFVEDGCEALRRVEHWPPCPGGYLRSTWNQSSHAPPDADPYWFDHLLADVTLPDGV
jgi:hypothetical protein